MTANHRRTSGRRRALISLVGVLALGAMQTGPAAAGDPGSILIYGPSLDTETPNEQTVAESQGHSVTVASEVDWADMSTQQFAAFDALVIGDRGCNGTESTLDTPTATRATWSPAVTGNVTISGFDPFAHENGNQALDLVANAINFATGQPGTGLYVAIACYPDVPGDPETLPLMDRFGTFTVDDPSSDLIEIVAPTHPMMAGLTNVGLSNWGQSTHTEFLSYPDTFEVLAVETDDDPDQAVLLAKIPPTCKGQRATVFGGPRADVLKGTSDADVIAGLGGGDQIKAGGGKDVVCAGNGKDVLRGGAKKDKLFGEKGRDLLVGGPGRGDVCKGGPGKDSAKENCERGRA